MGQNLRYALITLICAAFSFNANSTNQTSDNFKLLNDNEQNSKNLLARGGGSRSGGGRSGGSRSYSRGSSGSRGSRSSMSSRRSSGSRGQKFSKGSSGKRTAVQRSSKKGKTSRSGMSKKSGGKKSLSKKSGKSGQKKSIKGRSKSKSGKKSSISKKSKGKKGKKVGKKSKSGKKGTRSKKGRKLGKSKASNKRSKKVSHHRHHHHGHHGHHRNHHQRWNHWHHGWWAASAWWGGVYFGLGAMYPFWYPWGGFWGPYWAATWPWAAGLYWYPRYSWWYWEPYDCWLYPFYGLGWGLIYPSLGYYWYPKIEVGIYNEVPESEDAPVTYAYVENESDEPLYYAVYRKVELGETSYLIKVSEPHVIKTKKIVKVYLPEDVSKDNEYIIVPRRDEEKLRDAMDEKGNEISSNIIEQIRSENTDLETTHEIEVDDPANSEKQELEETKYSARKDETKIKTALEKLDEQDKDELPKEKDLPAIKENETEEA